MTTLAAPLSCAADRSAALPRPDSCPPPVRERREAAEAAIPAAPGVRQRVCAPAAR